MCFTYNTVVPMIPLITSSNPLSCVLPWGCWTHSRDRFRQGSTWDWRLSAYGQRADGSLARGRESDQSLCVRSFQAYCHLLMSESLCTTDFPRALQIVYEEAEES